MEHELVRWRTFNPDANLDHGLAALAGRCDFPGGILPLIKLAYGITSYFAPKEPGETGSELPEPPRCTRDG